jgi:hypothetical protein
VKQLDFKGIAQKLQARLLVSVASVGIQASGGRANGGRDGLVGAEVTWLALR